MADCSPKTPSTHKPDDHVSSLSTLFPNPWTRAIWWANDIVMAIPQYAVHLFWFGLFGLAVGGTTGLAVGIVIGLVTSTSVSWITIHYVRRTRRWIGRKMEIHKGLRPPNSEPPKPAVEHLNWVAIVYSFLAACEASILAIVVVYAIIIFATENHEVYLLLKSYLAPTVDFLFSHFSYLDDYFQELRAAGQGERAEFVKFGFTSIWIVGFPAVFKVAFGTAQGWVLYFRCVKLGPIAIDKQYLKGFLILFPIFSLVPILGGEIWHDVEGTFSPYMTGLPQCSTYSVHGFIKYLSIYFPAHFMMDPLVIIFSMSFFIIVLYGGFSRKARKG